MATDSAGNSDQRQGRVGTRISLGSYRGTIRYVGPVPPTKGEWLGIEWDDPSRGKHNGVASDGKKYFDVRVPESGSFVRPTASKLSYGSSFLQALSAKYLPPSIHQEPKHFNGVDGADAVTKPRYSRRNLADIEIEAPNMDGVIRRAARLDRVRHVGLGGWKVQRWTSEQHKVNASKVEDQVLVSMALDPLQGEGPGSIKETCPNIQWLDLSRSLLPDWEQVAAISVELERLECLMLHFNRLEVIPEILPHHWKQAFASLRDLRLDGTLITWNEILRLSPALPSLQLLQLGQNQLTTMTVDSDRPDTLVPFPRLETLVLDDNLLSSWSDIVASLASLPRLENLYLNSNLVSHIPRYTQGPLTPSLRHVGLCKNPIANWEDLQNLESWLSLEQTEPEAAHRSRAGFSLDIVSSDWESSGNKALADAHASPLVQFCNVKDFRPLAIARLARLQVLDRSPITPRERRDAELYILGKVDEGSPVVIRATAVEPSLHMIKPEHMGDAATDEAVELSPDLKRSVLPRYDELTRRYHSDVTKELKPLNNGVQDASDSAQQDPTLGSAKGTLKAKLIEVRVSRSALEPSASNTAMRDCTKVKLISSTALRLARIKLSKAAGVKSTQVKALWAVLGGHGNGNGNGNGSGSKDASDDSIAIELDDPSRDLLWYGVGNGDEIVVVADD